MISIEDIRKNRKKPKRYPIKLGTKEIVENGCDVLFGYDFNFAKEFAKNVENEQ